MNDPVMVDPATIRRFMGEQPQEDWSEEDWFDWWWDQKERQEIQATWEALVEADRILGIETKYFSADFGDEDFPW